MKTIVLGQGGQVETVPSEFEFRIVCQGRRFHLKAPTAGEKAQWLFAFEMLLGKANSDKVRLFAFEKLLGKASSGKVRSSAF